MALEIKKREKDARIALKLREKNRKEAIKSAKIAARTQGKGKSIKELLGGELWFEEKVCLYTYVYVCVHVEKCWIKLSRKQMKTGKGRTEVKEGDGEIGNRK